MKISTGINKWNDGILISMLTDFRGKVEEGNIQELSIDEISELIEILEIYKKQLELDISPNPTYKKGKLVIDRNGINNFPQGTTNHQLPTTDNKPPTTNQNENSI